MKILGSIILTGTILFIGFYVTILTALVSGKPMYVFYSLTVILGLIIFSNLFIFDQFKKRWPKVAFSVFASAAILFLIVTMGHGTYINSLKILSTQDVELYLYEPFAEDNKLATLDAPASLTLTEDLPKLDGSTALYPVFASFVQAVYPEKHYSSGKGDVISSQTSGAWEGLLKGTRDIVFVPQPPDRILREVERQEITLLQTPIGREAFVFFVHKNNPVESLTVEQIQKIYAGEITNWSEVGGKNEEIYAFQRPEDSGSQQALIKLMGTNRLMTPPKEQVASGMGGMIESTAEYENRTNAIGFSFRFFSQDMVQNGKIKYLSIEGVKPTIENIQNDTYPIISEFYAVTLEENKNPNIKPFIDWIVSNEGQELVKKTGYVPVNE
ncbi:MAG: substrate-binding domain-containing protein [Bacillaceae bacterium]|nr:substrate-binding domain-containing protein [Bacillaceae bacterium]